MRTGFSTTQIYFVFAHTYCMLSVYPKQEQFVRRILANCDAEFLNGDERESWQVFDVPMTLSLIADVLPQMTADAMLSREGVVRRVSEKFGLA